MIRQLIVVRAADFPFLARPHGTKPASPHELFSQISETLHRLLPGFRKRLGILGVPSLDWEPYLTQDVPRELPPPDRHVIALSIADLASLEEFRQAVEDANNSAGDTAPFPGVGADLSLAESEYFCPTNVDQILFGDRAAAAALTRSQVLKTQGLTGQGVNIVVIDEGFDANMVRNFGGGLLTTCA